MVFSPSSTPPEIELQSVFAVARIAQHLYGATQSSLHMVGAILLPVYVIRSSADAFRTPTRGSSIIWAF